MGGEVLVEGVRKHTEVPVEEEEDQQREDSRRGNLGYRPHLRTQHTGKPSVIKPHLGRSLPQRDAFEAEVRGCTGLTIRRVMIVQGVSESREKGLLPGRTHRHTSIS